MATKRQLSFMFPSPMGFLGLSNRANKTAVTSIVFWFPSPMGFLGLSNLAPCQKMEWALRAFPSPMGFLGLSNQTQVQAAYLAELSFPSPMGFLGLPNRRRLRKRPGPHGFPSPMGFLGLSNLGYFRTRMPPAVHEFPSPMGFLGLSNLVGRGRGGLQNLEFPSPMGFLGLSNRYSQLNKPSEVTLSFHPRWGFSAFPTRQRRAQTWGDPPSFHPRWGFSAFPTRGGQSPFPALAQKLEFIHSPFSSRLTKYYSTQLAGKPGPSPNIHAPSPLDGWNPLGIPA